MSACTTAVLRLMEVLQEFTPSFQHHCLGVVERTHRTRAERLTPYVKNVRAWDEMMKHIVFSIDVTPHALLKY